jgi:hypothetical protein
MELINLIGGWLCFILFHRTEFWYFLQFIFPSSTVCLPAPNMSLEHTALRTQKLNMDVSVLATQPNRLHGHIYKLTSCVVLL